MGIGKLSNVDTEPDKQWMYPYPSSVDNPLLKEICRL